LGVEASLVTCLMKENADFMSGLAELAKAHEVNLRINIYKPVFGKNHCPDFGQFWSAIRKLMQNLALISCSEPIVNAAIGNVRANEGAPCGHSSFRIQPEGGIVPCVYLRNGKIKINNLIEDPIETHRRLINAMELPLLEICKECDRVQICQGGCKARRMLSEKPAEPDGYCFVQRNFEPNLKANWKESKGLVHENYLCTMIFSK
jgi:radical SAM protein with 4Fe4S-binding SPASM domain